MKHKLSTGEVLHFTEHMKYRPGSFTTGKNKMEGMMSLNTSSLTNTFCQKMHKHKEFICHSCYAIKLESFRAQAMGGCFNRNSLILSKRLKDKDMPVIAVSQLRFNAFGELTGAIHYKNLIAIAEANPNTIFTLWTKRANIIKKHKKALNNFLHVYSSPKMNTMGLDSSLFDRVFTVYNTAHIREHNIKINCQAFCKTCLLCYTHNDVRYINEKVRSA